MKYKCIFLIALLLFVTPINASRGCCSHHGGISYCGDNGYYICNDNTRSPSCRCSYINDVSGDNNYSSDFVEKVVKGEDTQNQINEYQKEIYDLKQENTKLKEQIDTLEDVTMWSSIIFVAIVFCAIYIKRSNKTI